MHCAVWKKERRPPPHAGIEGEREKKEERGKTRGGEEDHCLKVDVGGRKQERKRVIAYILERKEKECPPHHPLDVKKTPFAILIGSLLYLLRGRKAMRYNEFG